jgi:hypothetical protein
MGSSKFLLQSGIYHRTDATLTSSAPTDFMYTWQDDEKYRETVVYCMNHRQHTTTSYAKRIDVCIKFSGTVTSHLALKS